MVALKGKTDIGDQINKKIIAPLANANKLSDMPDFNDADQARQRQGDGGPAHQPHRHLREPGARFLQEPRRRRRHPGRRLRIPDAALRHRERQEQGPVLHPRRGQPHHGARSSASASAKTSTATTVYDPTCGSGSLLLKVGDEAGTTVTLYGQEKDAATSGLARMNMILHNNPTALIVQGNTLADPKFKDGDTLKTFDTSSPIRRSPTSAGAPASIRCNDPYERFQPFGTPPAKQGDYAYLLHIIRSLKSTGKGACILPHGVLFRGNAEADIRRNLVRKGYIKGIIGLPANLFYGTGIPACIVVIDKEDAHARKGIFMIDASQGFMKDGPKNRLRAQDIHKIVDVFNRRLEVPKYSRMVSVEEIEKNEFNLNLPRYIDSQTARGHAGHRGPPARAASPPPMSMRCSRYWAVCPQLRQAAVQAPTALATSTSPWRSRPSRPPSTSTRSSPPSSPA